MIKAVLFDFWNTIAYIDPHSAQVKPIAGIEHALLKLKEQYKLAILSNTSSGKPAIHLNELGFDIHFERFFFSLHTGYRKPESEAYLKACQAIGLKPEECAYIDDLAINVQGAKNVGMYGIHYNGSEEITDTFKRHNLL